MKKYLLLLIALVMVVNVFAFTASAAGVTETENSAKANAFLLSFYSPNEGNAQQAVKICSQQDLLHYLNGNYSDYWSEKIDPSQYDDAYFQAHELLCVLIGRTGSYPPFEITSVQETDASILVQVTRPDDPVSPDMASWVFVLERDKGAPEKEVLVNGEKLAEPPYSRAPEHAFVSGICTLCGAKASDPSASSVTQEFPDVPADAWYAEAVNYAVVHKLMNGMENSTFQPETPMTRGMLVTVLWRYASSPETGASSFSDVPAGEYYAKAVAWAARNGVVNGVGENRFDPEGNVTREQMATILYRYTQKLGKDSGRKDGLAAFPDAGAVSDYAGDAVGWAVAEGILNGSDGKLLPQDNATRAEVATILMRFIENILK